MIKPRAAYLHTPFCAHRCGYCNFAVVAGRDDLADEFLLAIATELSWLGEPCPVDTLYFGGGTPTQLPAAQLATLCETSLQWHPLADGAEWTVEANPADLINSANLDEPRIEVLKQQGVTRVSLGVQSFDDAKLQLLERDHTGKQARRVVERLQAAGFEVSFDLIFAAPSETLAAWEQDLTQALELCPTHLSVYGLTYEKGTSYWTRQLKGDLSEVDEGVQRDMYLMAIDRLAGAGLEQYEVSNFAKPGHRSRHNQVYWAGQGYYAAGPGAARYVSGVRETNHRSTTEYLRRIAAGDSPVAEREELTEPERRRELLVLGLRRIEGIERQAFRKVAGAELDDVAGETLAKFVRQGLLQDDGSRVRLTREGLLVSDSLWPGLL